MVPSESFEVVQPGGRPSPLGAGGTLVRLGIVGAIVGGTAVAFAFTGGWLTPRRLTPATVVDQFEKASGPQPGFRRNHAKGICFTGHFDGNGKAAEICKSLVFAQGSTPVFGRFALAGGMPFVGDTGQNARSMAVDFKLTNGQEWRMGINNVPVFPVSTPEAFFALLQATTPDPKTGKPDPEKMGGFVASHPEFSAAMKVIKANPISSGFGNSTFNSLDAFIFHNAEGVSTPVRWAMVPIQPFIPLPAGPVGSAATQPDKVGKNYLFDALISEVAAHPLQWKLMITIGQPGDSTRDATIAWPADRRTIDAGTLTIEKLEDEAHSPARDINFDPLVLPDGMSGSDDPILSTRSAAYSTSFTRREGEKKQPSAVSIPDSSSDSASGSSHTGGSK